jgi:HlyD family secretion protein
MHRKLIVVLTALSLAGAAVYSRGSLLTGTQAAPAPGGSDDQGVVAAPGTVEPTSEEIDLSAEISGRLDRILVEEGVPVRTGQVLATLASRDYLAQLESARATLQQREAESRRVVNGARTEERTEALAGVEETDAVLTNAISERDRRRGLLQEGAISREEAERAEQTWLVAQAKRRAAAERYALVNDAAREEDRTRAAAAVDLARAGVAQYEALLAKAVIRSPIDGVVLRKHHRAGESVIASPDDPVLTVGDVSGLRVRAEVDELDVARVRIGQRAYARADAFGDRRFSGRVTQLGQALGKKHVRTEQPSERVDSKVLQVLIDLEDAGDLRPELRMDVFIQAGEGNGETR